MNNLFQDWKKHQLSELIDIKHGYAFSSKFYSFNPTDKILLTPGNFHVNGYLYFGNNTKYYTGEVNEEYILDNGDLLIVMTDLTKEMNILGNTIILKSPKKVLHNQRIGKIVIKDKSLLNQFFLVYLLNSNICKKSIKNKATGSTVRHTSNKAILSLQVPLPPLQEQEKITEILSNCDRAIELTEKLIASKRKLKRGLMQKLLTGKIRFPEFKEQSFWKKCYLGDLGVCCSGGTPSVNIGEYWNGDIPWCTPTEITALNTPYISSTRRHISKLGLRNSSAELLPKNSVIVCTRATIGYSAINLVPMATNQGFKSIIPNENTDTVFLYYLINSIPRELTRRSAGSTFSEISRTLFKKIPVYIPSLLEEQEKIASLIYKVDLEIEKIQKQRALLQQTKKGLMQQLLTGKTRVPLNQ